LDRSVIELDLNVSFTNYGAALQYSANGRFGDWKTIGEIESGINWYNEQNLSAIPGDDGNPVGYRWNASFQSDNEITSDYVAAKHSLAGVEDKDGFRNNIIFRLAYRGENKLTTDGFAIDNVAIGDRSRLVLLEHFENTTQSSDQADFIKGFPSVANQESEMLKIHYRTGFGGDDLLFNDNRSDVNARALFYDITSVPRAVQDGDASEDDPYQDWAVSDFGAKSLASPEMRISLKEIDPNDNLLQIEGTFTALRDIISADENFLIHFAVVEKLISLGGTDYEYVMKKMLPDAAGTKVDGPFMKGNEITVTVSWEKPQAYDFNELAVIAFAQNELTGNESSRHVYQSGLLDVSVNVTTGVESVVFSDKLLLYPNPTSEQLNLVFQTYEEKTIKIFDQFGKMVYDQKLLVGIQSYQVNTSEFASGVYFAQIESNENGVIRKKFILSH